MRLLKLIGVLMDYPQDELWQHREELIAAADNPQLSKQRQAEFNEFVRILLNTDPFAAQDAWLSSFERGRSMSLLLFEHIHGESRDRGQAMVDLIDTYRNHGFELAAKELPDYLPLLLEYLSHRPPDEARDWLGHIKHIVAMLPHERASAVAPTRSCSRSSWNSPPAILTSAYCGGAQAKSRAMTLPKSWIAYGRKRLSVSVPSRPPTTAHQAAIRLRAQSAPDRCSHEFTEPVHVSDLPVHRAVGVARR